MRILATLSARADAAYDHTYHDKLRGRVWNALEDTPYDSRHDSQTPLGLSFSNPFPWTDMDEGDTRNLLFASPDEQLLGYIASDLASNPELNIGQMPFTVTDQQMLNPDVGEPGERGVIETATGVVCRIRDDMKEQYGINNDHDQSTFWRKKHTFKPFKERIRQNLQYKHHHFGDDQPGPTDRENPQLFDGFELKKTFPLPVTVTQGETHTHILSKWKFSYTVRDDLHRSHLNLLLNCGLGERNTLGFGFCNIRPDEDPDEVGN